MNSIQEQSEAVRPMQEQSEAIRPVQEQSEATRPVQEHSEAIRQAMQELVGGTAQVSTSQSNFIESCHKLLQFPFHSESKRLCVVQSLMNLNGNFVMKIIEKGLSGLARVYTSAIFDSEAIHLVELCVSIYQKQCHQDQFTPSPAIVVDCTVELCDEIMKSRQTSTEPEILLSECLKDLIEIYETIVRGNLILEHEYLELEKPPPSPINTFNHIFLALKSRISDDLFKQLLQETFAIARRDQQLDFLNAEQFIGKRQALLLSRWIKILEFPFVTNWFAIQVAKKDVVLHDQEYAQQLPFGYPTIYDVASLICRVFDALKSLSSQGSYELPDDKKRIQVIFDHPEILLHQPIPCLELLVSNTSNECIQKVFGILGIQLNRELLPKMTEAELETHRNCMNRILINPNLHEISNLLQQFSMRSPPKQLLIIAFVVETLVQAMVKVNNQKPILKILSFWKETFDEDHDEYVTLSIICILIQKTLKMEQPESNLQKLADFLTELSTDVHSTLKIQEFLETLVNEPVLIEGRIKEKSLEVALCLFENIFLPQEHRSILYAAIGLVSEVEPHPQTLLIDFLNVFKSNQSLNQSPHYTMVQNILTTIEQRYSTTEKAKLFRCFLEVFRTAASKTEVINAVTMSQKFLELQTNVANIVKFFGLLTRRDDSVNYCHQIVQCSNVFKHHDEKGLNEFVSHLFVKIESENFDHSLNKSSASKLALKSFSLYLKENKIQSEVKPCDKAFLCWELHKVFHQLDSVVPDSVESYTNNFVCGLQDIFQLPLPLLEMVDLIIRIADVLREGKFKTAKNVYLIMGHLFKTEDNASLPADGLSNHFKEVTNVSVAERLVRIPINTKIVHTEEGKRTLSLTLIKLLAGKTPSSFTRGTSKDLFEFIINQMEKRRPFAPSILAMGNAIIEKNITDEDFKEQFRSVEGFVVSIPFSLIPLVSKCHSAGLTDKTIIWSFIKLLRGYLEDDLVLQKVNQALGSVLDIPRQLVLAFQETSEANTRENEIKRVLDVTILLDPLVLNGGVSHDDGDSSGEISTQMRAALGIFQTLAPYDFHSVMRYTPLMPEDVGIVMSAYTVFDEFPFYTYLFTTDKASLDADTNWCEDYDPSKPLTPGKVTYLILDNLKRLSVNRHDLQNETLSIFKKILGNCSVVPCVICSILRPIFPEYIAMFTCILKGSRSLNEIKQWLALPAHDVVVCKDLILEVYSEKQRNQKNEKSLRIFNKMFQVLSAFQGPLCSAMLHLNCIANILKTIEDEETIDKLLELFSINVLLAIISTDVIAGWNKTEGLAFLNKLKEKYPENKETTLPASLAVCLQLVIFVSKAFPNSAIKVGDFLSKVFEHHESDDTLSLGRILVWLNEMINSGFPRPVIESWCTSLILYEKRTSSDVDAIANLTPSTIQGINKEPGQIEECLFREQAPKTWEEEGSHSPASKKSNDAFKRCLSFAKILNEFASITKQFQTNSRVLERIKEGTHALCSSFVKVSAIGNLYKIRYNILKDLFVLLFSGEVKVNQVTLSDSQLVKSLVIVFRRLARSVNSRPILFGHLKSLVDKILQRIQESETDFQTMQRFIHQQILGLEPNQDAIHSLHAAGYNQSSPNEDLWYSSSIEVSSNVLEVVSVEQFRMQRALIQILGEWRGILMDVGIKEVEVNGEHVKTTNLMNPSDSLETMELQLEAVKKATQDVKFNEWSSHRRRQLMRKEKDIRNTIQEEKMSKKKSPTKPTKLVIIWDNEFLKSLRSCSEKIPGCYAPNGFHSEKPVICGLSVDSKIITLFKEEKSGTLTELEDVEVKLFPVGMLVFSVYSSVFSYNTDQLWAAFFKELLVKRLVPKIFLTNVSPGFEWIKRFVQPVSKTDSPKDIKFYRCNSLIPTCEDSFDYDPNSTVFKIHTAMADPQMNELIILTRDNVTRVTLDSLQSPNRTKILKERRNRVRIAIEKDLKELHPNSHEKIQKRLNCAIQKAVELTGDGNQPTEDTVSSFIDMRKLSQNCEDSEIIDQNGTALYGGIILTALQAEVVGENTVESKPYECVVKMQDWTAA